MKAQKTKITGIAALALAGVLSFSVLPLTGCGSSSSDSGSSNTQATSTQTNNTSNSSSSSNANTNDTASNATENTTNTSASSNANTSDVTFDDVEAAVTSAYMGTNEDTGEGYYLAFNDDGSLAMVAVLNTNSGADNATSASWVGPATVDGNNVTVTDIANGGQIGFDVTNNDDGTITLDLGDEYGKATVAQVDVSEVINAFKTIDKYTTAVQ